jgi:hypothetical protein
MKLIPILDIGTLSVVTRDRRVWLFRDHHRTWRMATDLRLGLSVEVIR